MCIFMRFLIIVQSLKILLAVYQRMRMNINYTQRNQPVKIRGQSNDINQHIHTLKQSVAALESKVAVLTQTNQELTRTNEVLNTKLQHINQEKERKALETFKIQNAERKQRAEKIRAYLGHGYESDEDE